MPAAELSKRRLATDRGKAETESREVIFKDKTGNTHGMRFKISPPKKATPISPIVMEAVRPPATGDEAICAEVACEGVATGGAAVITAATSFI